MFLAIDCKGQQLRTAINQITRLIIKLSNLAICRGTDGVFHFHGFHYKQGIALFDNVPCGNSKLDHSAIHRGI